MFISFKGVRLKMKDNVKIARTEATIKATVIELIKQKSLAKLSISDITRGAKINRGTFYLHYVDKNDLIDHYEKTLIDHLKIIFDGYKPLMPRPLSEIKVMITTALTYIDSERPLFNALMSDQGDITFTNQLKRMFLWYVEDSLEHVKTKYSHPIIPEKYAKELVLDSVVGIVTVWVTDPHPDSIEKVANILTNTRFMAPVNLAGVKY
ncbi:TetR family transcriptional regulator [Lactobacillus rossiae]|uniref:TetR family transcriptional regulator n=2 Tax=Furfurilactobacillus milii TaxID=2888272 RepID=A0A6N9I4G8_9LACO|nr:TetR family transcriptional regulator [Furfurilactobacillus milii]